MIDFQIIFKLKVEEFLFFYTEKESTFQKGRRRKFSKTYEGGNIGAKEVDEEKDKEENVIGGNRLHFHFFSIIICKLCEI